MKPWSLCAEWYRARGYLIERSEYRKGPKVAKDAWGVADLVAIRARGNRRRIYVQACHESDVDNRVKKALHEPCLPVLLKSGHRFVVMGWKTRKLKGKRAQKVGRIREIILSAFQPRGPDPLDYVAVLEVLSGGQIFRPAVEDQVKVHRPLEHHVKKEKQGFLVTLRHVDRPVDNSVDK